MIFGFESIINEEIMDQFVKDILNKQILENCMVNGAWMPLKDIEEKGIHEFGIRSKLNMPVKLYKYYSNLGNKKDDGSTVNYSQMSLKNNTVYMQIPTEFDDVYDSDITLDYETYEKLRVMEYCRRCGVDIERNCTNEEVGNALTQALWPFYLERNMEKAFVVSPENEIENLSNQILRFRILANCTRASDFGHAVSAAISEEYKEFCNYLKDTFRISCFTTTPFSQLMWGGAYADQHKGFCVEYTILPEDNVYQDVYSNLFPVVYCKTRPDVTASIVATKDKYLTDDDLWNIYMHGALRKSIDWVYQNEWRLLLPLGRNKAPKEYNVKFFPITKVFLGNRMSASNRLAIIEICKKRGIPYAGVTRNPRVFEMQECNVLCEKCARLYETK
jgi:hypothetical protein